MVGFLPFNCTQPKGYGCGKPLKLRYLFFLFVLLSARIEATPSLQATIPNSPIDLSLVPSRTSGVAPLAVFFDASGTTDTGVTTHPFHDLEYTWIFGDPNSGTWAYGSQPGVSSKNSATGPVAAHVFETPGTYTVSLTAFDGANSVTTNTTITVQNPDTVFAGSNTICVTNGSTYSGCPSGAVHVGSTTDFPTIISKYARTGKRLLLKRGDTFISSKLANITQHGPMIIGAYGSGAKPYIYKDNQSQVLGFDNGNQTTSDIRIMDLSFDGANNTGYNFGIGLFSNQSGAANILLLRNYFTGFVVSIGFGGEGVNAANNTYGWTNKVENIFIVENETGYTSNTQYSAYNSAIHIAMMGNHFNNGGNANNPNGSHVTRWLYLNGAVISHNDLFLPGFNRHCIYVVGAAWSGGAPDPIVNGGTTYSSAFMGDGYTKNVIISDNHTTDDNSGWQIILTPVSGYDMRIKDVILERNLQEFSDITSVAQVIRADYVTSRNNIILSHADNHTFWLAQVDRDGIEPAHHDIWIYNNTMYKSIPSPNTDFNSLSFAYLPDTGTSNVTIRNNLGYSPGASGSAPYYDAGITNLTASNNSTAAQINNKSPLFNASPPSWRPLARSYPINGGTTIPVWSDFYRNSRPQNGRMDIGAVEDH